ncbi:MAG: type II toxin-antitoxin system HicB family antitoxin [Euryarchaeota archaeon]|nr:type II toxin-antitoxin system HicB family antitoxin [Euryarchaeota archaeon]
MPVLPRCIPEGITRREAEGMAKDAIEAWMITALRFDDEIPAIERRYQKVGRLYRVVVVFQLSHIKHQIPIIT